MDPASITIVTLLGVMLAGGISGYLALIRRQDELRKELLADAAAKFAALDAKFDAKFDTLLALILEMREDNRGLDSRISHIEGRLKVQPFEPETQQSSNDTEATPTTPDAEPIPAPTAAATPATG